MTGQEAFENLELTRLDCHRQTVTITDKWTGKQFTIDEFYESGGGMEIYIDIPWDKVLKELGFNSNNK
jgi:hypothetical protein